MPAAGMDSVAALERSLGCARGRAVFDYGLHGVVTPETGRDFPEQFARLASSGVASVKAFTTYEGFALSGDDLLATFDAARAHGMTVLVHAENDAAIRRTRERLLALGRTAVRYHAVAHSAVAEREATHRAIALAEIAGTRVVIVHVSCAAAAEEVARARARGVQAIGETCPQYLFLTARDLDRPAEQAVRFVFSPPPRGEKDQERLWAALREDELSLWSSDHAPYRLADKLSHGPEPAFHEVANGVPGLATRLPLLFSEGLLAGRLTLARYLDLAGRNAASVFGLDHVKGRIEVGLDADLAIWDPAARWTLRHADLRSAVDFTPYEGREVTGRPVTVLVRGVPVVADGALAVAPGFGSFVPRRPADPGSFPPPIEDTTPWLEP
jgi:dihydropyrimidinase